MNEFRGMPDASASEENPQESREAGVSPVEGVQESEGSAGNMRDGQVATAKDNAGRSADIRRKHARNAAPSFDDVHQRIQSATHTRTQNELANILGIRQSSISDAKRRNRVPSSWYMLLFEKFGLSQDWLRYGIGPMLLRTEQGYAPQESSAAELNPAQYGDPAAKSTLVTVYSMHCRLNEAGRMPELDAIGKLALPSS
ncbi:MAG: helix-turn-helix domain containing protein, partial [Deltaproteobacteria bacterium]|nr:helix-turn-helix domain containing protein [Deltaproteobacteria bacterium]